jgi:hypothetical protein
MKIYQIAFLITWIVGLFYIGSNRFLLWRLRKFAPALHDKYQGQGSLGRSAFLLSLITGEDRSAAQVQQASLPLTLSRLFLGLTVLAFFAFVATLIFVNEAP